jgi:hypothetical protein
MNDGERILWQWRDGHRLLTCVMRSCCAGAELQLLDRAEGASAPTVALRELYPSKSDLYERARQLERDLGSR